MQLPDECSIPPGDFMELELVLRDGQTAADCAALAEALMQALGLTGAQPR